MSQPKLMTFATSHYCEKARWALDRLKIGYEEELWPLGPHIKLSRRLGAPQPSVPILQDGERLIQGSGKILDWAESNRAADTESLEDAEQAAEIRELETQADDVIGVEVRRLLFSQTVTGHPQALFDLLYAGLDARTKSLCATLWPKIRPAMIDALDVPPEAADDARAKLERELDRLDARLSDGRRFLAAGRLTRADIATASLLAPFAGSANRRLYKTAEMPPEIAADIARWRDRPSMQWVETTYRDQR